MRLFIAIDVPDAWRAAAAIQQQALEELLPLEVRRVLRPVRGDLMHLTVRFLGELDEAALMPLQAALDVVLPFAITLSLDRAGTFGPPARTGVAWLGVEGEMRALRVLARDVERAVRLVGMRAEERPFTAHLTLARLARGATPEERRLVAEAVQSLEPPPLAPFIASQLLLVRSHLDGPSPRYEVLSRHP